MCCCVRVSEALLSEDNRLTSQDVVGHEQGSVTAALVEPVHDAAAVVAVGPVGVVAVRLDHGDADIDEACGVAELMNEHGLLDEPLGVR